MPLALLLDEPLRPVFGCPDLVAHQARSVFSLWQRWEERSGKRQEPPFWAAVWPGAALLARVLLAGPERVRGRRVIDLGCGSGIVAIAAAIAGARRAVANDLDPIAVAVALANAEANRVRLTPLVADLTRTSEPFAAEDVLILSEIFYDRPAAGPLLQLAESARSGGASVLVADGGRAFLPSRSLVLLDEAVLPVDPDLEGVSERHTRVYEWVGSD